MAADRTTPANLQWMGWAATVREVSARPCQEVALQNVVLLASSQSDKESQAKFTRRDAKQGREIKSARQHLSLDMLLPCASSSVQKECLLASVDTAETLTPISSPASSGKLSPLSLTPPPGLSRPRSLSPAPELRHLPPLRLTLADSLSPTPTLPSRLEPRPVAFRPPPGLPPPPGFEPPSSVCMPRDVTRAHGTSIPNVHMLPQYDSPLPSAPRLTIQEEMESSSGPSEVSEHAAVGLSVHNSIVDGAACTHVEWLIRDPMRKLRTSCGFPIVSPEFDLGEGGSLRLAFIAGGKLAMEGNKPKTNRRQKKVPSKTEPPSYGSLQLKALDDFNFTVLVPRVSFAIGGVPQGVLELSDRTIQGVELITDWRTGLEGGDSRDLRIGVDFFWA